MPDEDPKTIAARLRVIAENQLYSEGYYTHANEVAKAADLIEKLDTENKFLKSELLIRPYK